MIYLGDCKNSYGTYISLEKDQYNYESSISYPQVLIINLINKLVKKFCLGQS